jgi:hypothetical protein
VVGASAVPVKVNANEVRTTVPTGASTGPVRLIVQDRVVTGTDFDVI